MTAAETKCEACYPWGLPLGSVDWGFNGEAIECIEKHHAIVHALETERDGLRAEMANIASQYEAIVRTRELSLTTEAFAEEFARRIRAALAGVGKP